MFPLRRRHNQNSSPSKLTRSHTSCLAALASLPLLLSGCVQDTVPNSNQRSPLQGVPPTMTNAGGASTNQKVARPAGMSHTQYVRTAVQLLGSVPYDNLSLPLVSPNGKYLVTQSGVPPTWPTVRAEPNAEVPFDTRVHIFLLDYTGTVQDQTGMTMAARVATVDDSVVLGRSSTDKGFLVESPRPDGSRWIGICDWSSGVITWLVQGGDVNAFAVMNEFGDLAWCRRTADASNFELVIQPRGSEAFSLKTDGVDWLMPVWGTQRDRLFVMRLEAGELSAMLLSAQSASSLTHPLHHLPLAINATVDTAYQCTTPFPSTAGVPRPRLDQLLFVHPVQGQTAIWSPLDSSGRQLTILPGDSISAWVDGSPYALVTTGKSLVRQSLLRPNERQDLLTGLLVPRPTTNASWPYVLLAPARPGQIGLSALNLLPVEPEIR